MAEISTGVWFDTKNNQVTDSEPEEGVQIVAPGSEMNSNLEADIKRYREMESGVVSTPDTVTTADVEKTDDAKKTTSKSSK